MVSSTNSYLNNLQAFIYLQFTRNNLYDWLIIPLTIWCVDGILTGFTTLSQIGLRNIDHE